MIILEIKVSTNGSKLFDRDVHENLVFIGKKLAKHAYISGVYVQNKSLYLEFPDHQAAAFMSTGLCVGENLYKLFGHGVKGVITPHSDFEAIKSQSKDRAEMFYEEYVETLKLDPTYLFEKEAVLPFDQLPKAFLEGDVLKDRTVKTP